MLSLNLPAFLVENTGIILIIASAITFPMTWISDTALRDLGFGILGNYVFLMVGSVLGAAGLMLHMGSAERALDAIHLPFLAAACGAIVLILLACLVKRLIWR